MVMADGIISAKELEKMYCIGRDNYNLTPEEISQCVLSAGTSFIAPEDMEDCISILYELAEIAWADGGIDDTEKTLLSRYAIRLGYKEENADGIADYMLQQVKNGKSKEEVIKQIVNF